jgi:uncharacterized protein
VTRTAPHKPRLTSVALFLALTVIAVLMVQLGGGLFPGDRSGAQIGRLLCSLAALVLLITGSQWLLQRDRLAADQLGLALTPAHGMAFVIGTVVACALILALLGVFFLVAPFELVPGPLPASTIPLEFLHYFASNFGEELVFRGYLLIALAQWLGTTRALWLLALPFGLFHFPGLDPLALMKTLLTTGAMHFVFAYSYLGTRSLWAAISLHAVSNTLLHTVVGTGKPAVLSLHSPPAAPGHADTPFLVFFGTAAAFAVVLSQLPRVKRGTAWLEAAGER